MPDSVASSGSHARRVPFGDGMRAAPTPDNRESHPMPSEPSHPVHALTTYEIARYRRELEHAIKGISPDAPVQADLRRKLDAVLAEQDERARIEAHAHP